MATLAVVLEMRLDYKSTTFQTDLDNLMENYKTLLVPDFDNHYKIDMFIESYLVLKQHQFSHFFALESKEIDIQITIHNLLYLELLKQNNKLEHFLKNENRTKRVIADYYDRQYLKKESY